MSSTTTSTIVDNMRVDVKVWDNDDRPGQGATVEVRCLPGYSWWSCPDSATLRKLVDRALREAGRKRVDTRRAGDYVTWGWRFYFATASV